MGRTSKSIDDTDWQEVLSMRDEFGTLQQDSAVLRSDMSKVQQDVAAIGSKQTSMCDKIGGMEHAVLQLGKQLSAMNSVLQSLVPKNVNTKDNMAETSNSHVVNQHWLRLNCKLKKQEMNI